jgi:SAM-dependent methyltransferase
MKKYVILANPGHNRIYFEAAMGIAVSELTAMATKMNVELKNMDNQYPGLPDAIYFESEELAADQLTLLSQMSLFYAIFEIKDELLKPLIVNDFHEFPESMVQILKYNGKTNEQFTRLLVNLAYSACKTSSNIPTLLDPMCGKGTTLYEGFMRGFHVKGVELNKKWTEEIQTYVVRFLKEGKFKHKSQKVKQTDPNGKNPAYGFTVVSAKNKEKYSAGQQTEMTVLHADTKVTNYYMKKKSIDMIVSDLPYGVQHGSKKNNHEMSRSPIDLMHDALRSWHHVLKGGGSIVLAFNEFTMKYDDLSTLMKKYGYTVLEEDYYQNMIHRVDQSINRNVIVARK